MAAAARPTHPGTSDDPSTSGAGRHGDPGRPPNNAGNNPPQPQEARSNREQARAQHLSAQQQTQAANDVSAQAPIPADGSSDEQTPCESNMTAQTDTGHQAKRAHYTMDDLVDGSSGWGDDGFPGSL
jgi:hypothetical protein